MGVRPRRRLARQSNGESLGIKCTGGICPYIGIVDSSQPESDVRAVRLAPIASGLNGIFSPGLGVLTDYFDINRNGVFGPDPNDLLVFRQLTNGVALPARP